MRDAIAKVKAELGDQAVIISTRQVRRGLLGSAVEISAAIDTEDDGPVFAPSSSSSSRRSAASCARSAPWSATPARPAARSSSAPRSPSSAS